MPFPYLKMPPIHSMTNMLIILTTLMAFVSITLISMNISLVIEWPLLHMNSSQLSIPVVLDYTGTLFMTTVLFVSLNILTFSKSYMMMDQSLNRFTHLMILFILSMNLLILSPNMISMMLGWDGLGVTSFLLVIYYQNKYALSSGMLTVLTNRVGDAMLLMAIALSMSQGQWNMLTMWHNSVHMPTILSLMILLAAMTKSAQLPFMAWLPAAMAAPTPVSALVHSSTLVTAGVFILIRFYPFLSKSSEFNSVLMWTSALTMLLASTWAMMEVDPKKVIALSTLSQLGLMMLSLSYGLVSLTYYHLITHAMFKSLMFMCCGVLIIFKYHNQNLRSFKTDLYMPSVGIPFFMSLLSMNAFPFMAGYFSKDMIIESALFNPYNYMILMMIFLSTMFTTTYSIRLYRSSVKSDSTNFTSHFPFTYSNDEMKPIYLPLFNLTTGSILMGSLLAWLLFPFPTMPHIPILPHVITAVTPLLGISFALATCAILAKKHTQNDHMLKTLSLSQSYPPTMQKPLSPAEIPSTNFIPSLYNKYYMATSITELVAKHKDVTMGGLNMTMTSLIPLVTKPSILALKILDHGWYESLGPQMVKMQTFSSSSLILMWQSNKITQMILLSFMMVLPTLTIII